MHIIVFIQTCYHSQSLDEQAFDEALFVILTNNAIKEALGCHFSQDSMIHRLQSQLAFFCFRCAVEETNSITIKTGMCPLITSSGIFILLRVSGEYFWIILFSSKLSDQALSFLSGSQKSNRMWNWFEPFSNPLSVNLNGFSASFLLSKVFAASWFVHSRT